MKDVTTLLRELVAIPSVSRMRNAPVIEYLQRFFADVGWHQRTLSYVDAAEVEKYNLLVSPQPISAETLLLELAVVCHTDTVPFDENWAEATSLTERDGMLHGCGACDVKGFLACMLACAAALRADEVRKPLCFVFTADEEVGCKGARFLQEQRALEAKYAIVGEPTSLRPARAGKGYALAAVTVHGQAAHSAYPEAGRSAILAAARMIAEIEALQEELKVDRNDAFSPAWTTLNVGTIQGGSAKNIVPAECSFLVEWRPIPSQDPMRVGRRLQEIADASSRDGIRVEVEIQRNDVGFETPLESALLAALHRPEQQVITVAFGTEAPWLARMGAQAVVLGAGSMLTAHSSRECVPVQELDGCVEMLHAAILTLCC